MSKENKHKGLNIIADELLVGIKYGFYISSTQTIFVSPAIKILLDAGENLSNTLKIIVMPTTDNGTNKHETLTDWVESLKNYDIYIKRPNESEKEGKP